MIALVPARAGSKRIPGKNTRLLAGKPVLVYTLEAAKDSGVFEGIYVSTEDQATGLLAERHGAAWLWRPPTLSRDDSADIEWVKHALSRILRVGTFAILRPTSPFRTAETIRRAYQAFTVPDGTHDSLRAVQPVREHPGKIWEWAGPGYPMTPLLRGQRSDGVPWHSAPTQTLPTFYVQNSSLEMAYTSCVEAHGTIHGRKVIPFFTNSLEGFTLDYPEDWVRAEALMRERVANVV